VPTISRWFCYPRLVIRKDQTNHIAFWLESISIFDSSDLTRFIVDSHVFTLPSKPSTLPRNARSSVLPSRARLHLSSGLHCWSGFKHHITVNACTLRLLPEERQVWSWLLKPNNYLYDFTSHYEGILTPSQVEGNLNKRNHSPIGICEYPQTTGLTSNMNFPLRYEKFVFFGKLKSVSKPRRM